MPRASQHWPAVLLSTSLAWLAMAAVASAQLPWSRLDALVPAGGQRGTKLTVRGIGADLDNTDRIWCSHPGITGKRLAGASPADHSFELAIAPEVPPGLFDLAMIGPLGLSNVRTFAVGAAVESSESEPNDTPANATAATLGTTINGAIGKPTDVDAYRFRAAPGRKVVIDCFATRIDSPLLPVLEVLDSAGRRIAFARSGRTGDATLVFEPASDAEFVARVYDQTYRGGDQFIYRLEIHSGPFPVVVQPLSLAPGATTAAEVFGLNLPAAQSVERRWGRWQLQQLPASITAPADPFSFDRILPVTPREAATDSFSWRLDNSSQAGFLRLSVGAAMASREVEPNQVVEQAQPLTLPADVSGDFALVGDVDWYRVPVRKGEPVWIEVFADRLGSPVDASLTLDFVPAGGERTRITTVDDNAANLLPIGFETQSDDPSFRFEPAADGDCLISVRDQYGQTRGDATLAYRLVVHPPQPDFRLVAVPTSQGIGMMAPPSLRRGDACEMTLLAFRKDGFDGPIEVPAAHVGHGIDSEATVIPARQTNAPLVFRSTGDALLEPHSVALVGRAVLATRDGSSTSLERPVRAATTVRSTTKVQTRSVPAVARLAREFVVAASSEDAPFELRHELQKQIVAQGRVIEVPLKLTRRAAAQGPVKVMIQGPAKASNIEASEITFASDESEKVARLHVRPDAPAQTVVLNWNASSKVQYRPNARTIEQQQLALAEVSRRHQEAAEQFKAAAAASAEAERLLTAASKTPSDNASEIATLEAARQVADKKTAEVGERVKLIEAELAAAEQRVKDLEKTSPAKELE
ncbi:MAG TPA: hypothetical protein VM510_05825, partial [Caulifigura sp.]|nr:hypothetical protein [Caulifigura sp.]